MVYYTGPVVLWRANGSMHGMGLWYYGWSMVLWYGSVVLWRVGGTVVHYRGYGQGQWCYGQL